MIHAQIWDCLGGNAPENWSGAKPNRFCCLRSSFNSNFVPIYVLIKRHVLMAGHAVYPKKCGWWRRSSSWLLRAICCATHGWRVCGASWAPQRGSNTNIYGSFCRLYCSQYCNQLLEVLSSISGVTSTDGPPLQKTACGPVATPLPRSAAVLIWSINICRDQGSVLCPFQKSEKSAIVLCWIFYRSNALSPTQPTVSKWRRHFNYCN